MFGLKGCRVLSDACNTGRLFLWEERCRIGSAEDDGGEQNTAVLPIGTAIDVSNAVLMYQSNARSMESAARVVG